MRFADPKPSHCAACFGIPEGRAIDFEASYDGPVIPGAPENQPVDDLVICEPCLTAAFGMLDPQAQNDEIAAREAQIAALFAEIEAKDKMIQGYDHTVRELVDNPVRKFPGRPAILGVSDQNKETMRAMEYARQNPQKVAAFGRREERKRVKAQRKSE